MDRRQRRNLKRREQLNLSKYVPWAKKFLVLLLLAMPFFAIPRIIKINLIKCESQFGPCSEIINQNLQKAINTNYLSARKQVEQTFDNQFLVSEYSMRYIFPSTFLVTVVEKKPVVALVRQSDTQKFYYIDDEGLILAEQKNTVLPRIVFADDVGLNIAVGQKVGDEILFAYDILQGSFIIFGSKLAFYNKDSIEVDLPNTIKVIFPQSGDTVTLLGSLNLILSQLNSKQIDPTIKQIDLRYKNPVIKYD